ncbi:ABC transporter ATP-binding protein [Anaeropeptidivorans aminofermentans]|uniref:ABC transporter ATP-binding protein n=1 Tax=Anaeropeptidivorans aminofermentans TaxID=2934315 RepID=UPI002024A4B9|nr:dipeptide/oligopeptide/nickel ABC transporter ATP-binding protein [Anaeropeptidivorans aminofermentans]
MLEARGVCKSFPAQKNKKELVAVNSVDFMLRKGELCALVGESGSGKSTFSRLLTGLIPPTSGDILLDGKSISANEWRRNKALCSRIQLVLQDGKSSLDPRFTIYEIIAEPIRNLKKCSKTEERQKIEKLIEEMELPAECLGRKPSELSGGQQKRVCIARALAAEPEIIIFDEAVSGLDVLVRKSILDLLKRLHCTQNLAYLFITHDMDVALYLANRILVMKDGNIVEQVYYRGDPGCFVHPYSRLLLQAMTPDA